MIECWEVGSEFSHGVHCSQFLPFFGEAGRIVSDKCLEEKSVRIREKRKRKSLTDREKKSDNKNRSKTFQAQSEMRKKHD